MSDEWQTPDPALESVVSEAFVTLYVEQPHGWAGTEGGRLFELLKQSYPHAEPEPRTSPPTTRSGIYRAQGAWPGLMRFWSEDRSRAVSVGPGIISVNHLAMLGDRPPFAGFQAFKASVVEAFAHYREIAAPDVIAAGELGYVFSVDPPESRRSPEEWFHLYPVVPESFGTGTWGTELAGHIPFLTEGGALRYRLTRGGGSRAPSRPPLVDLDVRCSYDKRLVVPRGESLPDYLGALDRFDLAPWLDRGHALAFRVFRDSITDATVDYIRAEVKPR